jgi:hypothetical protein
VIAGPEKHYNLKGLLKSSDLKRKQLRLLKKA